MPADLVEYKRGRERWTAHLPLTHPVRPNRTEGSMKPTHCAVCGTAVAQHLTGARRIVCSDRCTVERRKLRRQEAKRMGPTRPCKVCGESIPTDFRSNALYCSRQCIYRAEAIREGRTSTAPVEERFWSKVAIGAADECWEWQAGRHRGYGQFGFGGRMVKASRMAFELQNGPIPEGAHIRHLCDNPPCCNPGHLVPGTHADNMRDMAVRERAATTKLTAAEALTIRHEFANGAPQRSLAAKYGVSQSNIAAIVAGSTWKHVGGPITGTRPEESR